MPINEHGWEITDEGNLTAYPYVECRTGVISIDHVALEIGVATTRELALSGQVGARYQVILSPTEARLIATRLVQKADEIEHQSLSARH